MALKDVFATLALIVFVVAMSAAGFAISVPTGLYSLAAASLVVALLLGFG